jgi:hypothetical protein
MKSFLSGPRFTFLTAACALLLAFSAIFLVGCGGKNKAEDSTVNGYICGSCKAKFFTARDVFAEHCPACKQPNIPQVIGFICEKDKHITLAWNVKFVSFELCQALSSTLWLPREKDLLAWGAKKTTQAAVCQ